MEDDFLPELVLKYVYEVATGKIVRTVFNAEGMDPELEDGFAYFGSPEGVLANAEKTFIHDGVAYEIPDQHSEDMAWSWSEKAWVNYSQVPEEVEARKEAVKERRKIEQNAGCAMNGMWIDTTEKSLTMITGALLVSQADPDFSVNWKLDSGWVSFTAPDIAAISTAARQHIQACFDREREICDEIDAGETYDIDAGWPSSSS